MLHVVYIWIAVLILFVIHDENKVIMFVDYVNALLRFVYMYIIKEEQTGVINIKCYHSNLHAC